MKKKNMFLPFLLILLLICSVFGLGLFIGYNLNKNNALEVATENEVNEGKSNESKTEV